MKDFLKDRWGQSLAEVLIATSVTAILIVAAISLISPVLQNGKRVNVLRVNSALNRELLDKTKSLAEGDWHNIANLSTSSVNRYYLSTTTSPFSIVPGTELISVGSTTYSRYFYIDEVWRDPVTGLITTSTGSPVVDPSTFRVTVVIVPTQGPSSSVSQIVTRSQNTVSSQSDWSGGAGFSGPTSGTVSQFSAGSNINTTTTPGSIILNNL